MVDRGLRFVGAPEPLALEIVVQEDVDSVCEARTMEWNTDKEESDVEGWFPLGEGNHVLVKTRRSTDFTESSDKP